MREYIDQFYNEGLATTFYLKPIKLVNDKIKNKKISRLFSLVIKILYTVLVILFAGLMFYVKWPL